MPCQTHVARVFACPYRHASVSVTLSKLTHVVTLVTYTWETTGLSLGADTDCPSLPRGRRQDIVLNWATTASLPIFSISLFTNIQPFDAMGN